MLQLQQTYKNLQEKIQAGLLIQPLIILLAGSSYIKLPKEVDDPRKGLINIQNIDDNECFKWCLVRNLNAEDHHPASIIKADQGLVKTLDFKDINFPVKSYFTT